MHEVPNRPVVDLDPAGGQLRLQPAQREVLATRHPRGATTLDTMTLRTLATERTLSPAITRAIARSRKSIE